MLHRALQHIHMYMHVNAKKCVYIYIMCVYTCALYTYSGRASAGIKQRYRKLKYTSTHIYIYIMGVYTHALYTYSGRASAGMKRRQRRNLRHSKVPPVDLDLWRQHANAVSSFWDRIVDMQGFSDLAGVLYDQVRIFFSLFILFFRLHAPQKGFSGVRRRGVALKGVLYVMFHSNQTSIVLLLNNTVESRAQC